MYTHLLTKGRKNGKDKGEGLGERTVLHIHRMLHAALKRAVKLRILQSNPVDAVESPKPERKEMHFLDPTEAARMVEVLPDAENDPLQLAVFIALFRECAEAKCSGYVGPI